MANEFIIKNGFHSKGDSQVTGSLNVSSTLTVNGSAVGAAFPFSGDAQITGSLNVSSSITTFDINMSTWTLGADGGNNYYYFTGPGDLAGTEQNPDIHLTRGQKYRFYNPMDAHPFQIQDTGGSAFSTGVTNNGVSLGFLSFDVPMDGPTHLKYQCTAHAAMVGNIYIADARIASGSFSGSFQGDGSSLTGISAGTNLTQSLFVSPSGNNGTAVVGNMSKPFATILAATASANIGDTIFVYPGTYLSETANIVKDGVNYYFHPGAFVSSSDSRIIDTGDLTYPINFRGYGSFEIDIDNYACKVQAPSGMFEFDLIHHKGMGGSGTGKNSLYIDQPASSPDGDILEVKGTIKSSNGGNGASATLAIGYGNTKFDGVVLNSGSGGDGIDIADQDGDTQINAYVYAKNGSAFYSNTSLGASSVVQLNGTFETEDQSTHHAIYIAGSNAGTVDIHGEIKGAIYLSSGGSNNSGVTISGHQTCTNSPSSLGAVDIRAGQHILNQKITTTEDIFYTTGTATSHTKFNGQINITSNNSGRFFNFNNPNGTFIFDGSAGDLNKRVNSNTITAGTLIIDSYLEHYGSSYPNNVDVFDLSGGTLEINNKIKYFQSTSGSGIINMTGGYLKLNGAQLISDTPAAAMHCILLGSATRSGSLFNNSFTNIPVVFQSGSFTNEITGGGTLFYSDKLY